MVGGGWAYGQGPSQCGYVVAGSTAHFESYQSQSIIFEFKLEIRGSEAYELAVVRLGLVWWEDGAGASSHA